MERRMSHVMESNNDISRETQKSLNALIELVGNLQKGAYSDPSPAPSHQPLQDIGGSFILHENHEIDLQWPSEKVIADLEAFVSDLSRASQIDVTGNKGKRENTENTWNSYLSNWWPAKASVNITKAEIPSTAGSVVHETETEPLMQNASAEAAETAEELAKRIKHGIDSLHTRYDCYIYDWATLFLPLAILIKDNTKLIRNQSTASVCRRFNILLQSKQPIWHILEKIKGLKDDIQQLKKAFFNSENDLQGLRGNIYLSLKADLNESGDVGTDHVKTADVDGHNSSGDPKDLLQSLEQCPSGFFTETELRLLRETLQNTHEQESNSVDAALKTRSDAKVLESLLDKITEAKQTEDELFELLKPTENVPPSHESLTANSQNDYISRCTSADGISPAGAVPGPLGESPIHIAFLLGLKDIGKRMALELYKGRPELIGKPYTNDLDPWRKEHLHAHTPHTREEFALHKHEQHLESSAVVLQGEGAGKVSRVQCDGGCDGEVFEDGLYTGETVLHMAIVQEDPEAVQFLLERGVSQLARATGAFFQPKHLRIQLGEQVQRASQEIRELWCSRGVWGLLPSFLSSPHRCRSFAGGRLRFTLWQLLRAKWFYGDSAKDTATIPLVNEHSSCYFGEFPLSFAASVGSVEICNLLYTYRASAVRRRKGAALGADDAAETRLQLRRRNYWRKECGDEKKALEKGDIDWERGYRLVWGSAFVAEGEEGEVRRMLRMELYVNAMDSFGNTAMHMAVLHGRVDVIDWLMTKDEAKRNSLDVPNFDGFTPLTLAARHGRVDIFRHMLYQHHSIVVWRYGKVLMRMTDLYQVDTFRISKDEPKNQADENAAGLFSKSLRVLTTLKNGMVGFFKDPPGDRYDDCIGLHSFPHWRSALEVIVHYDVGEFAGDPLFNKLINEKWRKFGRAMYLKRTVVPYGLLLLWFSYVIIVRTNQVRTDWNPDAARDPSGDKAMVQCLQRNIAGVWPDDDDAQKTQKILALVLEIVLALFWPPWLLLKGWRHRKMRITDLDINEDNQFEVQEVQRFVQKNLPFLLFTASGILLFIACIARVCCWETLELDVLAITSVFLFCNLMNLLIPFRFIGFLVITIYRMIIGNIFRYLVVYTILLCAFSFSFCLLCQRSADVDEMNGADSIGLTFLHLTFVSLGDNIGSFIQDLYGNTRSPALVLALYYVWVILSLVLMLNLLIAMMGKTFDDDSEAMHLVWIFPYASLVLRYEKMLARRRRIQFRHGVEASWVRARDKDRPEGSHRRYYEIRVEHADSAPSDSLIR